MSNRRAFLIGLGAAIAAPAVVRAESLMKIAALHQSLNERTLNEVIVNLERDLRARAAFATAWDEMVSIGWSITRVSLTDGDIQALFIPAEKVYA